MHKILFVLLISFITIGFVFFSKNNTTEISSISLIKKIPNITFENLDSSPFLLNEKINSSKIIILHFWATWCGPCEVELPDLLKFYENSSLKNELELIIVAVNDDKNKVKKFLKTIPIINSKVSIVFDNGNIHQDHFGTFKLPETFLFDQNGQFLQKFQGPQNWQDSILLNQINSTKNIKIPTH
jgi:cytochrome c biogenesis protein CcmG/thiol:disulfide interchange protein DsbE